MNKVLVFVAALAGLSACGPLQGDNRAATALQALTNRATAGDSAPEAEGGAITRAQIEAQPVDLLRVSIIDREVTAFLARTVENGSKVTWISVESQSLTFDNGLLVASRGLGGDLMGADVSGAVASLENGGNHLRTLDFINSLDQIEQQTYQCSMVRTRKDELTIFEITYDTTIIEETCTGSEGEFKNTYWRDNAGVIWQSRQWISESVGYLGYQRL